MADRKIEVFLKVDGKEYEATLGKAAKQTETFGDKVKGLYKQFASLIAAGALGAFFKSSVQEAAAAEVQMARLGVAVRNAGGDFGKLRPQLEETVASVMRMSTATDDELREALTRMITVSGDVEASQKNLALVTDLAAFKQIELSDASDIVAKAMAGNTTALNKMGIAGKDSTVVLDNLRAVVAGFAAKEASTFQGSLTRINNQWGEFQEAVGKAILAGGEAGGMADSLANKLAGLAAWVEQNEDAFRLFTGAISFTVDAMALAFLEVGHLFKTLVPSFYKATGEMRIAAGKFIVEMSRYMLFSRAEIQEWGKELIGQGMAQVATMDRTMDEMARSKSDAWARIRASDKESHGEVEREVSRHGNNVTRETSAQAKERVRIAKEEAAERERILKDVHAKLEQAAKGLNLATVELAGYWQQVDREARKASATITITKDEQRQLTDFSRSHAMAQQQVAEAAEESRQRFRDNVDSAASLASSLISAASGMGKLSNEAAGALTSVLNMGVSIAKFGIGSPEGVLSIVGGLAQLIGGWGSSPAEQARREAHMKNTRAIEELSRDLSEYNGSASGETFGTVLDALEGAKYTKEDGSAGISLGIVKAHLASRGMSLADARALAEKYDIDLDKDPDGWVALLEVMRRRRFGSPLGNFGDELSSLSDSFGVLGVEDADDKLAAFRDFTRKHVPILAEALAGDLSTEAGRSQIVERLRGLYTRSINNELTPADFGKATPQQFRQIISTLLPLLGDANGLLGSGLALGTGVTSGPVGSPGTGGTAGLAAPLSGPALSALGAVGIPVPQFPEGFLPGGTVGGGNTILQGDFVVQTNITDARDPAATAALIADEVARILGGRLVAQRQALGLGGQAA